MEPIRNVLRRFLRELLQDELLELLHELSKAMREAERVNGPGTPSRILADGLWNLRISQTWDPPNSPS